MYKAYFLIPFSLLICILAILRKDIKNGHILEHRWSCYCGHYDQFCDICHNGRTYNGHKFQHFMVFFDIASKIGLKADPQSKPKLKKHAIYTKSLKKKELDWNNGNFLCILRWFWLKNGPSKGGTSHVSSELILTVLDLGE